MSSRVRLKESRVLRSFASHQNRPSISEPAEVHYELIDEMAAFQDLFKDSLIGKDGQPVCAESLEENDLVGIYFSAHWCPPCRGFTPVLAANYTKLKKSGKKFEIVFVSSDRDEASFKGYYNDMPWLAVRYEDRDLKSTLAEKYGIKGIPTLILLNKKGETVSQDGRSKIGDVDGFPWNLA